MLATNALVIYKCIECGLPYTIRFTTAKEVTEVVGTLDKSKRCTVCGRGLKIISAAFKIIDNKYGDVSSGSWRCPTHLGRVYYPAMIKKALEQRLNIMGLGLEGYEKYLKIADAKWPWKCPICNKQLMYTDEKYKYIYNNYD